MRGVCRGRWRSEGPSAAVRRVLQPHASPPVDSNKPTRGQRRPRQQPRRPHGCGGWPSGPPHAARHSRISHARPSAVEGRRAIATEPRLGEPDRPRPASGAPSWTRAGVLCPPPAPSPGRVRCASLPIMALPRPRSLHSRAIDRPSVLSPARRPPPPQTILVGLTRRGGAAQRGKPIVGCTPLYQYHPTAGSFPHTRK